MYFSFPFLEAKSETRIFWLLPSYNQSFSCSAVLECYKKIQKPEEYNDFSMFNESSVVFIKFDVILCVGMFWMALNVFCEVILQDSRISCFMSYIFGCKWGNGVEWLFLWLCLLFFRFNLDKDLEIQLLSQLVQDVTEEL